MDAFSFPLVRGEPSRVIGQVDLTARAKRSGCKRFQTRLIAFILISFGIIGGAFRSTSVKIQSRDSLRRTVNVLENRDLSPAQRRFVLVLGSYSPPFTGLDLA